MRYCTSSRIGRMPRMTRRSNMLCPRPALIASLHRTTGPSWQWSPTSTSCWQPLTTGMRHSGSVACVASSTSTCLNLYPRRRGSPEPTHVVQITSAARSSSCSALRLRSLKRVSSLRLSSPCRSLSCCSLRSSERLSARVRTMLCRHRWSTDESTASRLLEASRTTRRPVRWIFSARWSTATLLGAHTRICPACGCCARWYTSVALVTVLPVPGGPWISASGRCSTARTALACEWFSSGRPGADMWRGIATRRGSMSTSCPSSTWYRYTDVHCSSTASLRIATCMRSKLVLFHTKSSEKPSDAPVGTLWLLRISREISLSTCRSTLPEPSHRADPTAS
mmetsp:Transcript_8729/g.27527  ORF Transcript_8729/g.27527 Transcript_8729/m.27527 type:complete len:338 (+) Transcript_8729:696-1709(+)